MLWIRCIKLRHLAAICWGLITVALYSAAFPTYNHSMCAFVFIVPWCLAFRKGYFSCRSLVIISFLTGWVLWLSLIYWLRNVTWIGYISLSAVLGLFQGAFFYAISRQFRWSLDRTIQERWLMILGWSSLWVLLEWIRTWLFTGFPWLFLAASQWQNPLCLQIVSLIGSYGLSFWIMTVNCSLAMMIGCAYYNYRSGSQGSIWGSALACLVPGAMLTAGILLYGVWILQTSTVSNMSTFRAGIVQPAIPAVLKWEMNWPRTSLDRLKAQSFAVAQDAPDIIIWPEAATPLPLMARNGSIACKRWVEDLSVELNIPILLGSLIAEKKGWYNSISFVSPARGMDPIYYAKQRRVPFGEYIPFCRYLTFLKKIVPVEENIRARSFQNLLSIQIRDHTIRAGALICYEDIYPSLVRQQALQGAQCFFVVTNDAWFGHEAGAYQHASHSVLRAVESGRPFIRCGNEGWSGWIDSKGRIQKVATSSVSGTIYFQGEASFDVALQLQPKSTLTVYTRCGDLVLLLAAGFFSWSCLHFWLKRRL